MAKKFEFKNLIGERYGKLLVVECLGMRKRPNGVGMRVYWKCLCDCGNVREVAGGDLRNVSRCKPCKFSSKQGMKDVYGVYKHQSKKRNLDFLLTIEEFEIITSKNCYYCGSSPSNKRKRKNHTEFVYQGIDRLNSTIGYNVTNVVPCCEICNKAKRAMPLQDFINWIKRLVIYQTTKDDKTINNIPVYSGVSKTPDSNGYYRPYKLPTYSYN